MWASLISWYIYGTLEKMQSYNFSLLLMHACMLALDVCPWTDTDTCMYVGSQYRGYKIIMCIFNVSLDSSPHFLRKGGLVYIACACA